MMVKTPEGDIKAKIKEVLKNFGAYHVMIQGGTYSAPGAPDMVILYRGKVIWTEVKTPTGVQEPLQKAHEERIKKCEGIYLLARSAEDVKKCLLRLDSEVTEERGREESMKKFVWGIKEIVEDALGGDTDLSDALYEIRDNVEEWEDEDS